MTDGLCSIHSLYSEWGNLLRQNQFSNLFFLPCCCARREDVCPLLLDSLVGHLYIPKHLGVVGGNDARVDIGTGTKIIEDTSGDGVLDELESIGALEIKRI